jgi:hypothetical protein
VVGLERAVFSPDISQILIGDATTRDLYFHNSNGLGPSAGPITVASPVMLSANRNTFIGYAPAGPASFYLNSGIISAAPGNAITSVTGVFDNRAGANALFAPNGRWLVYAADPATSSEGFATYNKHYDQPYTAGTTPAYATTGNWFLYSVAPALAVRPSTQTITYGDAIPTFTHTLGGGYIDGDTEATAGVSGTATWAQAGPTSSSGRLTAGTHDVSLTGGLISSLGYRFADHTSSSAELTVVAKALTAAYTARPKIYDGTTAAIVSGSSADLIPGDVVSFSQRAAFRDPDAGVAKPIDVTAIAVAGPDATNYALVSPVSTSPT